MNTRLANNGARYRLSVASRVVAAAVVGYAFTSTATVLLALLWPLPRAEAVLAATMLSFMLYALVIVWAFSVKRVGHVWIVLSATTVIVAAVTWCLLPGAAA